MEDLPEGVDHHILHQQIVPALKAIMDASGSTLHEAIDVLGRAVRRAPPQPA
ncbi:hypothetical protein ACF1HU_01095 [Streptomyces olivaceus]|uniref:hypothetical protein n=1 Tax=Streptomyces olivaceus TaxID=47716 RepID=UPI0036FA06F6